MDFIHSCKDSVNVSNTPAKQRLFALWHSCPAMAAQPGAGVTLFPSLLSTLCFHPPCFIGGLSKSPADTTACLGSRFARDDAASGRQSKISPIPPGLPENSTEARFAAQHTRGCVRVSLLSTRLRSSGGEGSEGTPRKARPIRGDGTTSGRTRHTLGHSAHADHACATPTWEVGGCTPWALLMRRSLATGTKMGECAPSIGPIVPPLRLQKPEQDEASV